MEISSEIIIESFKQCSAHTDHDELRTILQSMEQIEVNDLLQPEEGDNGRKIHEIISRSIYAKRNKNEQIEKLASILVTTKHYLIRGINDADVKQLLIFLRVNCYLKIEIKYFLSSKDSEVKTDGVSEKIRRILQTFYIQTNSETKLPYYEKKLLQDSTEGIKTSNIESTYSLILTMERSGRGFHINYLAEELIALLYQINYPVFLNTIFTFNDPNTFVFFLQSFKKEWLLHLASDATIMNRWLCFEIIRQIIEKEQKDIIDIQDKFAVGKLLEKIKPFDFDFFIQTGHFFSRSPLFNAALGTISSSFANEELSEVVYSCFKFDVYDSNMGARNQFLLCFDNNASNEKTNYLLQLVYERWSNFINKCFNDKDFYANSIITTDYCNFIISYYTTEISDEDLKKEIFDLISKIKYIDSEWAFTESNHLSKYHLYCSKLYLTSYAYKIKQIKNRKIFEVFNEFLQNKTLHEKFSRHSKFNFLNIIEENLNFVQ